MDKARAKRWAKRAGIALGGVLLVLALAVGALFIWLGTDSARRLALGFAEEALAGQGLYLKVEETAGQLPFGLELRGLSLADGGGVWLELADLSLELSPFRLFGLTVQVDSLRMNGLRLSRQPVLPEQAAAEPAPVVQDKGFAFSMPVEIRLDEFTLDGAAVEQSLLAELLPEQKEKLLRLGKVALNARASGAVLRGPLLEPGNIRLDLQAELSLERGRLLSLNMFSGPGNGQRDALRLDLRLEEQEGGVLSCLGGLSGLPAYSLSVSSASSLRDLRLNYELKAERLAELTGALHLAPLSDDGGAGRGSLEGLITPNWRAELSVSAQPGPLLSEPGSQFAVLPESALNLIGSSISLSAAASSRIDDAGGAVRVDILRLENELLLAGLYRADLRLGGAERSRLDFSGAVMAQIKDARFFELLGVQSAEAPMFGKSSLSLASGVGVDLGGESPRLEFSFKGPLEAESHLGDGQARQLSFNLDLSGKFAGELTMETLRLAGMGLELEGGGSLSPEPLALDFAAELTGDKAGEWNELLRAFSGSIPGMGLKASLTAKLDARQNLAAGLRLSASGLDWPMPELERGIGPYLALVADFSGPLASPYVLKLDGLVSGPQPVNPAAYDPELPLGDFSGVRARAEAEISLPGVRPHEPLPASGPVWSLEEQLRLTSVNGRLDLAVADLGLFLPEDSGFSGALRAAASVSGVAGGEETSLHLGAEVSNCADKALGSPLGALRLAFDSTSDLRMRNGLDLLGKVRLHADSEKAGPFILDTGWELSAPPQGVAGEGMRLAVSGLESSFAGLSLQGDAGALMPAEAGAMPALSGKVTAHFENWKGLNEIFSRLELGVPPLTGTPMELVVAMKPGVDGQSASLSLGLERLYMALGGEDSLAALPATGEAEPPTGTPGLMLLNGIAAKVDVTDLWQNTLLSAYLKTDAGSIDAEKWDSFALLLDLADKSGRVNLAVRNDGDALGFVRELSAQAPPFSPELVDEYLRESGKQAPGSGAASAAGATPAGASKAAQGAKAETGLGDLEMALVSGVFRLDPLALRIDRAALFAPELHTGFYLQKPAFVRVGDDIRVQNVDFAVLPDGHLRADAHFSTAQSKVEADIKDLPLALIRKLAGVPMPDGELSLSSSMHMSGGEIGGKSELSAVLRPASGQAAPAQAAQELFFKLNGSLGKESGEFKLPTGPGLVRLVGGGSLSGRDTPENAALRVNFDVPFRSDAKGLLVPDLQAPLAAALNWRGELGRLWGILSIADRHFNGMAQIDFKLGGNLSRLEYGGSTYLAGGRYEDRVLGLLLADINLEAKTGPQGSLLLLSAGDGAEGKIAFEASIDDNGIINTGLGGGPAHTPPALKARGQINHLAPLHRDDVYVMLSGLIDAAGPLFTPEVTGKFELEQTNINLLYSLGGGVTTLPVEEKSEAGQDENPGSSPMLNITVEAPRRFYVRGPVIDSEWQVNATVEGPVTNAAFTAVVSPVRGYVDLLSRPFALSKGQINVWGGRDYFDSSLDLLLSYSGTNLTAEINAGGSVKRPTLQLSSTPPLPQDQILAQVLFGKDITQLSAIEALQVANGVRQLMAFGQGGIDIMGEVRDLLGVDTLRIGSSGGGAQSGNISGSPDASDFGLGGGGGETESAPTVEAGKYINDSIYMGIEQGTTENSTRVRVEVELKPNLTLQGSSGGNSSQVGLGWKRDY